MNSLDELLWHYTSWEGIQSILEKQVLWATHIGYMNDAAELTHALSVLHRKIEELRPGAPLADRLPFLVRRANWGHVCAACFSSDRDSLSQWRAYSRSPPGFAIGFDRETLLKAAQTAHESFVLVECDYGRDRLAERVTALIEEIIPPAGAEPEKLQQGVVNVLRKFVLEAPKYKHEAFSGEKEWRIYSASMRKHETAWGFHRSGSLIAPHLSIPLGGPETSPIRALSVGPSNFGELMYDTLTMLGPRHGYTHLTYERSSAPYRT